MELADAKLECAEEEGREDAEAIAEGGPFAAKLLRLMRVFGRRRDSTHSFADAFAEEEEEEEERADAEVKGRDDNKSAEVVEG